MNPYLKQRCACCKGYFSGDEDIVTCPDCGAPVHRICWEKLGHCPYADKHGTGFEWTPEIPKQKTDTPPYFSPDEPQQEPSDEEDPGYTRYDRNGNTYEQPSSFEQSEEELEKWLREQEDNFYRNSDANNERRYMGVSEMELTRFISPYPGKGAYTLNVLKSLALTGRKATLNVFALFLSPIYQFYRRMYVPAVILAVAFMILNIPQLLFFFSSYAGLDSISAAILSNSSFITLNTVFYYISIALSIFMGIFGDRMYLNWAVKKIISIRQRYAGSETSEEYYQALAKAGNPGFRFALLGLGIMAVISYTVIRIVLLPLLQ